MKEPEKIEELEGIPAIVLEIAERDETEKQHLRTSIETTMTQKNMVDELVKLYEQTAKLKAAINYLKNENK